MTFANPLLLLLVIPVVVAAWRLLRRGRKRGVRFSAFARIPVRSAGWRAFVAAQMPFVLLLGLLSLIVSAARPRSPLGHERKDVDAIAIAMTVDVSGSMLAKDISPTRLDAVKRLFARFVERRPDDLIGLVTFGGYAATLSPLTADHEALTHVLKAVHVPTGAFDAMGRPIGDDETMTAMGDGIATALMRLKDAKPKSKIIILLSDGVSNTGAVTPDAAAEIATKMGVKIYIVGIGVVPEVIEIPSFFGVRRIRSADLTPEQLVETLGFDERQLKNIADKTGGVYFPVSDSDGIEKALAEIDQLETTRLDADVYNRWREHFSGFLIAGVLLVLSALSLSMFATRRLA